MFEDFRCRKVIYKKLESLQNQSFRFWETDLNSFNSLKGGDTQFITSILTLLPCES